jgi:hypothetical protein
MCLEVICKGIQSVEKNLSIILEIPYYSHSEKIKHFTMLTKLYSMHVELIQ